MVRVLQCHHFASQDVFTTENEPLTVYSTGDLAFVATDQCYIEVYKVREPGCPRIQCFPTVAPVKSLVYSESGDFIATLEEKSSGSDSESWIRVYLNWRADLSSQPMRASIAGHMTSLRHMDEDKSRFEVVEVPLKGDPQCITVDPTNGAIAIGLEETLLVYGFCTKTVAETNVQYRDIKCLLELQFSFEILQVAFVEDYLAVSSQSEIQVVMFKMPLRPGPDIADCTGNSIAKSRSDATSTTAQSQGVSSINGLLAFENRTTYTPSPSQSSHSSQSSNGPGCNIDPANNYIVEDEHFVQWTFDDTTDIPIPMAKKPKSSKMASVAAASANALKTIMLKGLATVQGKKPPPGRHHENGELLGPVDNPLDCPVTVEYEDVCNPAREKRGHVIHGVRTCLYRKFDDSVPCLHSLQLVPVYLHGKEAAGGKCCVLCPASDHDSLVGMCVFVSTPKTGYLYNVQNQAQLLAAYPYTMPASSVSVGEHMVYAVTSAGVEVYTSRGLSYALHHVSPTDDTTNTLPPADLTPCLIGLQPFIGAVEILASAGHVLLLTKDVTSLAGHVTSESSWSLYVLRSQQVAGLYRDMIELADHHRRLSPPASLQLLQEAHTLLRTHRFLHGTEDDVVHGLICESAALLGDHYSSTEAENDWHLTLPYYVISGYDVGSIIRRVKERRGATSSDVYGRGLMLYLDYMFFTQDNPVACSERDGDLVVEVYSVKKPSALSALTLRSALSHFSCEKALEYLQNWMQKTNRDQEKARLDILAASVLLMKTGQPDEAEVKLLSLTPVEIFNTCVANPWVLHEEYTQFSPLAQMLRRHHRSLFCKVLVALLDQGVFRIDNTITILQGKSDLPLHENRYVMEYLEQILANDSRERFFQDTARRLIDMYLGLLKKWTPPTSIPTSVVTVRDVIPKGPGHFAKRFTWLDYLPPFKGPKSMLKPCVRLRSVRSGQSEMDKESCSCCHCNAELLKLQSLLCSPFVPTDTLHLVESDVARSGNLRGVVSLRVLCAARLKPPVAIDLLFDEHPDVLPHFSQEMLGAETELWRHLVHRLFNKIEEEKDSARGNHDKNDKNSDVYLSSFKSILAHMSEVLSLQEVLSLSPEGGSTSLFLPAIHRTHEKQRAQHLKELIITRARQFEKRPP